MLLIAPARRVLGVGSWHPSFLPLNTLLGITFGMNGAMIDIIGEKDKKMKIIQNIYGMSETMYWTTWFTFYGLIAVICMCIIYICWLAIVPILTTVNFGISFIILVCAYVQTLLMVFCTSLFMEKPRTADALTSVLSILLLSLSAASQFLLRDHYWLGYVAGCLPLMNCFQALSSMLYLGAAVECNNGSCRDIGANFDTLHLTEFCMVEYDPIHFPCIEEAHAKIFPLSTALMFLVVDTLFLAFLLWWLSQAWQGKYGKAKPWCFCLMPKYMCSKGPRRYSNIVTPGTSESEPVLSIQHLRKVFRDGKVAVDDLSLEVFPGEIFALLGHNGAGKTTALNCAVGLTSATSGDLIINGYNVETDLELARQQMSVCPQDNPLFEEFTVKQHLAYFSTLRGVLPQVVDQRADAILSSLGLGDRANHPSGKLSGGQKRRLWVATALIGDSPVAFLDEPTSGMDPSSRRELWALLLKIRDTGRSIIFTTHYLEEADILANRKAVLARGRVQAVGTSRELKRRFGIGYRLTCQILPKASRPALESFAKAYVKSAALESEEDIAVASITMSLDDVGCFSKFLLALEDSQDQLGVIDYALGMSSLEDVFMALEDKDDKDVTADKADASVQKDLRDLEAAEVGPDRTDSSEWRCAKAVFILRLKPVQASRFRFGTVVLLPFLIQLGGCYLATLGATDMDSGTNGYAIAIYPAMSFGFVLLSSCQDVMTDIKNKCKYVSMSQGLSARAYWLGNFMAHLVLLLPAAMEFVIVYLLLRPPSTPIEVLPMVILAILLYPIPLTLCVYNFTVAMAGSESVSKVVPVMLMTTQLLPALITSIITAAYVPESLAGFANAWHVTLSVLNPNYGLPGLIAYIINVDGPKKLSVGGYFATLSAVPLYMMFVTSSVCLFNLVRLDTKSYQNKPPLPTETTSKIADEDVLAEEERCKQEADTEDAARYQELSHTYRLANTGSRPSACAYATREFKYVNAVRSISLGIQKGECFSLLGPNGAGKTTTLGILTGEIRTPSAGKVSILGHDMSLESERAKAFEVLGVCPQVDPVWDEVRGNDHLRFYGRIKGVAEDKLDKTVMDLMVRLGLSEQDAMKPVGTYSGGMKRKLSVGIALIGHSKMLFLDEPSAAVDAGAKRHLWKVIKSRGPDQTVVLTTHSMEEAGALSSRMAIQVMGQLRCLGTPMHIKHKYGTGYQLELFFDGTVIGTGFASKKDELVAFVQ